MTVLYMRAAGAPAIHSSANPDLEEKQRCGECLPVLLVEG